MDLSLYLESRNISKKEFALMVGVSPTFKVCGWIKGVDGKSEEFAQSPNGRPPAFFVPQHRLNKFKP